MKKLVWLTALAALAGCASYSWTSSVPEAMRTVAVPTFRNESNVTELGSVTTRQVLREFQREGTFKLAYQGAAAVEIQGVIKTAGSGNYAHDSRRGARHAEYRYYLRAEVSVIDKLNGKVLVDNRPYEVETFMVAGQDLLTAKRDASGRLAEERARAVVDDVLALNWKGEKK